MINNKNTPLFISYDLIGADDGMHDKVRNHFKTDWEVIYLQPTFFVVESDKPPIDAAAITRHLIKEIANCESNVIVVDPKAVCLHGTFQDADIPPSELQYKINTGSY